MKNFDLEAAKKGAKVCTKDGREVRVLCFDLKDNNYPICASFIVGDREVGEKFSEDGRFDRQGRCELDLMMADDDYMEKLERGEYGKPDHIGEATDMVDWEYWRRMYAGMAMQGLMADYEYKKRVAGICAGLENQIHMAAEMAVIAADALIDELKKEKK